MHWTHYKCESLTSKQINTIEQDSTDDYICKSCVVSCRQLHEPRYVIEPSVALYDQSQNPQCTSTPSIASCDTASNGASCDLPRESQCDSAPSVNHSQNACTVVQTSSDSAEVCTDIPGTEDGMDPIKSIHDNITPLSVEQFPSRPHITDADEEPVTGDRDTQNVNHVQDSVDPETTSVGEDGPQTTTNQQIPGADIAQNLAPSTTVSEVRPKTTYPRDKTDAEDNKIKDMKSREKILIVKEKKLKVKEREILEHSRQIIALQAMVSNLERRTRDLSEENRLLKLSSQNYQRNQAAREPTHDLAAPAQGQSTVDAAYQLKAIKAQQNAAHNQQLAHPSCRCVETLVPLILQCFEKLVVVEKQLSDTDKTPSYRGHCNGCCDKGKVTQLSTSQPPVRARSETPIGVTPVTPVRVTSPSPIRDNPEVSVRAKSHTLPETGPEPPKTSWKANKEERRPYSGMLAPANPRAHNATKHSRSPNVITCDNTNDRLDVNIFSKADLNTSMHDVKVTGRVYVNSRFKQHKHPRSEKITKGVRKDNWRIPSRETKVPTPSKKVRSAATARKVTDPVQYHEAMSVQHTSSCPPVQQPTNPDNLDAQQITNSNTRDDLHWMCPKTPAKDPWKNPFLWVDVPPAHQK